MLWWLAMNDEGFLNAFANFSVCWSAWALNALLFLRFVSWLMIAKFVSKVVELPYIVWGMRKLLKLEFSFLPFILLEFSRCTNILWNVAVMLSLSWLCLQRISCWSNLLVSAFPEFPLVDGFNLVRITLTPRRRCPTVATYLAENWLSQNRK